MTETHLQIIQYRKSMAIVLKKLTQIDHMYLKLKNDLNNCWNNI